MWGIYKQTAEKIFQNCKKNHTNIGLKRFSNGNRGYCASDTITDCASATLQKPIV